MHNACRLRVPLSRLVRTVRWASASRAIWSRPSWTAVTSTDATRQSRESYGRLATVLFSNGPRILLRKLSKLGMLKTAAQPQRLDLLPPDPNFRSCLSASSLRPCFRTGSTMTNLMPTSAALHTIFVRHHNRITKQLLVNA